MEITFSVSSGARGRRLRRALAGTAFIRALLLCSLATFSLDSNAQPNVSDNLEQVRTRIDELEKSLADEEIKFKTAREEVLEIERRLHAARLQSDNYRSQLETKTKRIASLREERGRLNHSYEATADAMQRTLIARFMLWRQPKLKVLLNNTDISRLQRNLKYYDYVATANNERLQKQTGELGQMHGVEAALKLEATKLRQIRNQAEQHLTSLNEALTRRSHIAGSLEKLLHENEQTLGQLQDDELQLAKLVDDVTDSLPLDLEAPAPFSGLKGELAWPTAGRIAKAPGGAMRTGGAKWSGVIIESTPGSDVAAVAGGQVAFADWFRNLGLLVIIDHGDGYMSLYGHNQELYKESGDTVAAGEIVASVGDTGGQSTTGLYFEIRQNGMPQDPRQWCKK